MGDREAAGLEFGEQRLNIAQHGLAGGRIAHMADRQASRKAVDGRGAGEVIADQPLAALGVKPHAVVGDDARRFLAAMLQRVQPEGDNRRRVGMIEDAEHAAMLAQPIIVEIDAGLARRVGGDGRSLAHHGFGAGAKGAGGGTFLLIKASSFCLSVAEPFAPRSIRSSSAPPEPGSRPADRQSSWGSTPPNRPPTAAPARSSPRSRAT